MYRIFIHVFFSALTNQTSYFAFVAGKISVVVSPKLEMIVTSWMYRNKNIQRSMCALSRENFEKKIQRARFEEKLHETVSNDFKWSFSFCSVLFSFSAQYIFIVSREKWKKIYNYLVRLFCSIGEFEVFKCVKIVEGSSFMSQSIFRALTTWLTETLKILNFIRKSKYT